MIRSFFVDVFLRASSFFNWCAEKAQNAAIFLFNWRRKKKVGR